MAANDTSHVNSALSELDLNDGTTIKLARPGPTGCWLPCAEVVRSGIPAKTPAAVFRAYNPTERKIKVPLYISGISMSALVTALRSLSAHFAVDIRDDEVGTWKFTAANGNERLIKVAWDGEGTIDEWIFGRITGYSRLKVILPFIALDPTFWIDSEEVDAGAFNGTAAVNVAVANSGDRHGYLHEVTYTGMVHHPKVTDADGREFEIEADMCYSLDYDGGENEPTVGDTIKGLTTEESGVLRAYTLTGGTWVGNDAAGVLYLVNSAGTLTYQEDEVLQNMTESEVCGAADGTAVDNEDVLKLELDPTGTIQVTYTRTGGAATSWWGYRSADSQLVFAKYGTCNLIFTGGKAGDDATIGVKHYPRYSAAG